MEQHVWKYRVRPLQHIMSALYNTLLQITSDSSFNPHFQQMMHHLQSFNKCANQIELTLFHNHLEAQPFLEVYQQFTLVQSHTNQKIGKVFATDQQTVLVTSLVLTQLLVGVQPIYKVHVPALSSMSTDLQFAKGTQETNISQMLLLTPSIFTTPLLWDLVNVIIIKCSLTHGWMKWISQILAVLWDPFRIIKQKLMLKNQHVWKLFLTIHWLLLVSHHKSSMVSKNH